MTNAATHRPASPRKRLTWRRLLGLLALLVLLAAAGAIYLALYHRPSPKIVTARGTPETLGAAYGDATGTAARLIGSLYLDRIVNRGEPALIASRQSMALALVGQWPEVYRREFHAFCAAADADPGAIAYGNHFLDMGAARTACRSAIVEGDEGQFYHAHNLDWDSIGGAAKWTTTVIRRYPSDGRYATVALCYPGMIGALDIINEHGVALSFNQLGFGRNDGSEPIFLGMRRIAETADSFEAARRQILSLSPGMPFIITLSHTPSRQGSIFERIDEGIAERPMRDGRVAAGNLAQAGRPQPTMIDEAVAACQPDGPASVQQLMADSRILAANNIYSVIFDFAHNRFFLASGTIPAAAGSFREYILFEGSE